MELDVDVTQSLLFAVGYGRVRQKGDEICGGHHVFVCAIRFYGSGGATHNLLGPEKVLSAGVPGGTTPNSRSDGHGADIYSLGCFLRFSAPPSARPHPVQ